jgi:hypothetical protein
VRAGASGGILSPSLLMGPQPDNAAKTDRPLPPKVAETGKPNRRSAPFVPSAGPARPRISKRAETLVREQLANGPRSANT